MLEAGRQQCYQAQLQDSQLHAPVLTQAGCSFLFKCSIREFMEVLHNLGFGSKEKQDFHAFYEVPMCNTESAKKRTRQKNPPQLKP